ncbi:MAG: hypothetical protein ACI9ES_003245, partial [Oceanospirillaceae bacterium]
SITSVLNGKVTLMAAKTIDEQCCRIILITLKSAKAKKYTPCCDH